MTISQRDPRSVRVEHDGVVFSLAYRLWWEGRDRPPESIAVEGSRITAFFLSASIRDTISADAHGVSVRREWSLRSPGPVRLTIDLQLDRRGPVSYLLPGVALGTGLPLEGVAAHGGRTAWPSAACLDIGGQATVAFCTEAGPPAAGIAASPVGQDDVPPAERTEGPVPLSLSLRIPAAHAGTAPLGCPAGWMESPGTLDMTRTFRVVSAPVRRIWLQSAAAVLAAVGGAAEGARAPRRATEVREAIRQALDQCLQTHLLQKGGVAGLRVEPGSPMLSASAGAGMAVLLRELFPADPDRGEVALRLADFCLKGQHPSGLFYETYDTRRGTWEGVPGKPDRPVIGIAASARIADRLLALADVLASSGMPHAKYRLAGRRFVDFFFDEAGRLRRPGALHLPGVREPLEPGLAGLEMCFPLARVFAETGHDRYRKALDAIGHSLAANPWGTLWLPASREGREPDAAAALLCGRLLLALSPRDAASGRRTRSRSGGRDRARQPRLPVDAGDVAASVLPWIYVNPGRSVEGIATTGGIVESFFRQRLVGCGAEAGFVLAGLASLVREPKVRGMLQAFSRRGLGFADRLPMGTEYLAYVESLAPTGEGGTDRRPRRPTSALGPTDARRLVAEAGFRLALAGSPARKPGRAPGRGPKA